MCAANTLARCVGVSERTSPRKRAHSPQSRAPPPTNIIAFAFATENTTSCDSKTRHSAQLCAQNGLRDIVINKPVPIEHRPSCLRHLGKRAQSTHYEARVEHASVAVLDARA